MRSLYAVALLALIGCKKEPTILGDSDKPPPAKCSSDAECTVIALTDCCDCCPSTDMVAVAKSGPTYERRCGGHCKVCVGPGSKDGKAVSCETNPKPADYKPVCRAGTCAYDEPPKKKGAPAASASVAQEAAPVAVKEGEQPPAASCTSAADCKVVALRDCCHCCAGTVFAPAKNDATVYTTDCQRECKVCVGPGSKNGKAVACEKNPTTDDYVATCASNKCGIEPKKTK